MEKPLAKRNKGTRSIGWPLNSAAIRSDEDMLSRLLLRIISMLLSALSGEHTVSIFLDFSPPVN
jgi:hypothetical protein